MGEYSIEFRGDHLLVHSDGEKDFDFVQRMWNDIAAACSKHDCRRVLGVGNTTRPVSISEAYDHAQLFHDLDLISGFRVAWVELNPEFRDTQRFIDTVCYNRGIPGRAFDSIDEARDWLLD